MNGTGRGAMLPQRCFEGAAAMTAGLAEASASGATPEPADEPRRKLDIVLTVNGAQHRLQGLDAHTTLLDVLGNDLH